MSFQRSRFQKAHEGLSPVDDFSACAHGVFGVERRVADQTLIHDDAQRPPVALLTITFVCRASRGECEWRFDSRDREARRTSEIHHAAAAADQSVRRLPARCSRVCRQSNTPADTAAKKSDYEQHHSESSGKTHQLARAALPVLDLVRAFGTARKRNG